ncbi:hypothetical protein JW906_13680 [bacterium]|nr:hypothetical protein [bacterium]
MIPLVLDSSIERKIRQLCDSIQDPFYLYDTDRIVRNCSLFTKIPYEPKSIHFAMMANASPEFIRIVKDAGLNIFVNSMLHLEIALEAGYTGDSILFAASAMRPQDMKSIEACGATLILDSLSQLDQWVSLFPDKKIGIRCNIGDQVVPRKTLAGYFIGKESRLGLRSEELQRIANHPAIAGLHVYVGTNITDIDYFLNCYQQIIGLTELFPDIQFLDFGGGFGLCEDGTHSLDMVRYTDEINGMMKKISNRLGRSVRLLLEPGRIIGGDAGYFVCVVTDVKNNRDRLLVGVNASVVQFPRPLFYPDEAVHPVACLRRDPAHSVPSLRVCTIFGCSTYSRDFLARDVLIPRPEIGDIVVFGFAGCYCATAHTHFLGFQAAMEIFK